MTPTPEIHRITTYDGVCRALGDDRLVVGGPGPSGSEGTVRWLRGMVSRFAEGLEHEERLVVIRAQLDRLAPAALLSEAHDRSARLLAGAGQPGDEVDVMRLLARPVPLASLAGALGLETPERVASLAMELAPGYFPGSPPEAEKAADEALPALTELCGGPGDLGVARITLLIQTCDATAALIGTAIELLVAGVADNGLPTEDVLLEVLRHTPPLRAIKRVVRAPITSAGVELLPGDEVLCDLEGANRDEAVFQLPELFQAGRQSAPSLTFGAGRRPCPGSAARGGARGGRGRSCSQSL